MIPSVGRIVHYVSEGSPVLPDGTQKFASVCRAAVVTEVQADDPSVVGLCVLNPTGQFFHSIASGGCTHDEGDEKGAGRWGGTWHWPERVEP